MPPTFIVQSSKALISWPRAFSAAMVALMEGAMVYGVFHGDLVGIQMNTGSPAAAAYRTLQDWIVGATFNGCSPASRSDVTCRFVKNGQAFKIVYPENGRAALPDGRTARGIVFPAPRAAGLVHRDGEVAVSYGRVEGMARRRTRR